MSSFAIGFGSSLLATFVGYLLVKHAWPSLLNKAWYKGIRVDGAWEIIEKRGEIVEVVGKIKLQQTGRHISGESERTKTRDGQKSNRNFTYLGSIHGHQVTLSFEDKKGVGFDVGTYVFIVQNDGNTMIGMATFHGKKENKIVSEPRTLKRVIE